MSRAPLLPGHGSKRLDSIQALRAFAALSVLLYHIGLQQKKYGLWPLLEHFKGAFGVDMFFVISGFIMMYVARKVAPSWRDARIFILKRVIRITPIYWFYTGLMAFLLFAFSSLFDNAQFMLDQVVSSFLFVPHKEGAITGVGWTLNYEMYFYALFAISIPLTYSLRHRFLACFLTATVVIGLAIPSDNVFYEFYTRPLLIEFALGIYVFVASQSYFKLPPLAAWVLIGLSVLFMAITMALDFDRVLIPYRLMFWGIPSAVIIYAMLQLEDQGLHIPRPLVSMGDASYSLYLSHIFVLPFVGKIFRVWGPKTGLTDNIYIHDFAYIVTCLMLSQVVAYASYYLLEKPLHRLLLSRFRLMR